MNSWENVQVFDGQCVGAVNRGDGRGTKLWLLYAGGDVASLTDNTDSSIGLAYMDLPGSGSTLFRRTLFDRAGSRGVA